MKLHTRDVNIERGGTGTETNFQIKTTAKAFDILSSGLYTNPILAVVRELSCNAFDAHVAAGNTDTPFEIHLPNDIEPWFHVKDFGIGLSDEDVTGLYTTYFESTKSDSNDYIGALGLGSKSPFSYTTSFMVTSRFEGYRRTYTVFINEQGVPTITKMGEIATDEPNGIEVKLTVKPEDFRSFKEHVAESLRFFPTKPTVVGVVDFKFVEPPATQLESKDWAIHVRTYEHHDMLAVQGNVAYKLSRHNLDLSPEVEQVLAHGQLVMFFEIGELEVAASREEIRYDDRSVKALNDRLLDVSAEVRANVEARCKKIPSKNFWEYSIAVTKMSEDAFGSHDLIRKLMDGHTTNKALVRYIEDRGGIPFETDRGWKVYKYQLGQYGSSKLIREKHTVGILHPADNKRLFNMDVKTGGVSRLYQYFRENRLSSVYVISRVPNDKYYKRNKKGEMVMKELTDKDYEKEYKKLMKQFKGLDILSVDAECPHVTRQSAAGVKNVPVYQFGDLVEMSTGGSYWNRPMRVEWNQVDPGWSIKGLKGIYFNIRNRKNIMYDGRKVHWNGSEVVKNFKLMIDMINENGNTKYDFEKDLYAVSQTQMSKFEDSKDFVNVFDLFRDVVPSWAKRVMFEEDMNMTDNVFGIKELVKFKRFVAKIDKLVDTSPLKKAVQPFIDFHKNGEGEMSRDERERYNLVKEFDRMYGTKLFADYIGKPMLEQGDLIDHYPMLEFVGNIDGHDIDAVFDYIELVDGSK